MVDWFRLEGGPIRVKKVCGFKNIQIHEDITTSPDYFYGKYTGATWRLEMVPL